MTADGLVNQINNPEVEVDISEPELLTRRRVLALRSVTSHLVGACHGQDLDFQDAGEVAASPPSLAPSCQSAVAYLSLLQLLLFASLSEELPAAGRHKNKAI